MSNNEQSSKPRAIGLLGGTFDPVHYGHLRTALELAQIFDLQTIKFIPCKQPVHKETPQAKPAERLAMLQLATQDTPLLEIDDREINRHTPSYMVDTVESLRKEMPDTPLCLILGSDAFTQLPTWHRWKTILDIAHIIVVLRPGLNFSPDPEIQQLLNQHQNDQIDDLHNKLNNCLIIQTTSSLEIAATTIRNLIHCGYDPKFLLPDPVLNFIQQKKLYQ